MVLLSAQSMDAGKIAEVTFTSADRVRDVIHNVNADGQESPYPKYRGRRPRQPTTQRAKRIAVAAEPMAGRAAMSPDDAGRPRTSTDARHDLQSERCLMRP